MNNETGILTERDEARFAEAVTLILTEEKRRQQMSQRCLDVVRERWTLDRAGERLVGHLENAIERWGRST